LRHADSDTVGRFRRSDGRKFFADGKYHLPAEHDGLLGDGELVLAEFVLLGSTLSKLFSFVTDNEAQ
jgi:hypothetical protein